MGCGASKVEDLPAVALCRDRCKYLDQTLRQTQALADSHVAYLASLRTLGPALHHFFHDIYMINNVPPPPPPPEPESEECSESESKDDDTDKHNLELCSSSSTPTPVSDDQYFKASGAAFINSSGGLASKSPPPPPPPISSTWDFLNLFDTYQAPLLYALEPEAAAAQAPAAEKIKFESGIDVKHNNNDIGDQEGQCRTTEKSHLATPVTPPLSVSVKQSKQNKEGVGGPVPAEAMRELHLLFDTASESGNQVLKSLQSHHHTISLQQEYGFNDHEGLVVSSQSLYHTLKTLFLWEKKLYDEVKAEERLRLTHEKKSRLLKHLEHNKAMVESPKVDSLRTALRTLTTKMKISIQIVDRISITINKLREEELWPQIIEFIHRLLGMWTAMEECHKSQYKAIAEAKGLDGIELISNVKLKGGAQLETAVQLKLELQKWNVCFSNWIVAQKGYVKALNGWVQRCLLDEAQETRDGSTAGEALSMCVAGRVGEPPVFVICNEWCEAMDRVSEKEVIEAIRGFYTSIHVLLEHQIQLNVEIVQQKQRMVTEEEEQKILEKVMRGRGKKKSIGLSLQGGAGEGQKSEIDNNFGSRNLVWDLKQTLMAMEKFTANSVQAYKELHARIEQLNFRDA